MKFNSKLLFFICFFIHHTFVLFSQEFPIVSFCDENNICSCEISDNLENLSEIHTKQILDSLNNSSIVDTAFLACCYHKLAIYAYYDQDDLIQSINYNKKAEQLRLKFEDGLLWRTYLLIGINYYDLDEYKSAIQYLTKALSSNEKKENFETITLLRNLGRSYAGIGDFERGIEFGELALKSGTKTDAEVINYAKCHLAETLLETNDAKNLELGIQYLKQALQDTKDQETKNIALSNLGRIYEAIKNPDQALHYYDQVLNSSKRDTLDYADVLNNIAVLNKENNVNDNKEQYLEAIDTLNKSLNLYELYFDTEYHYYYAMQYENLGDVFGVLQQFDTAILHYQKALTNLTNNFRNDNIIQNPHPTDDKLFIYSNPDIIRVLHLKATAAYQYYQQNKAEKYLTLANKTYQTAFDFHDKLQQDISTENSRLFQAKNIVPYIENALKVAYQQQENEQNVSEAAFRFMEKNKATVLLQSMNEANALQFSNLPVSLLEQEKKLKIALTYHKKQLNEAIEYEDSIEIDRLDKLLFDEKHQYNQLINNLENNYPKYYQLKYQQNQTQLTEVQNQLDDKTALIEYFVGDSAIYILSIIKEHAHLYKVKKPVNWKKLINNLRQNISNVYQNDKALFTTNAWNLSQLILDPVLCDLPDEINRLQFIPDAELNYIPFGVFLTEDFDKNNIQYKSLKYLLKSKSVGYAYSAALWLENKMSSTSSKKLPYNGYAPTYFNTEYTALPVARETVEVLANSLNGNAILDEQASIQHFLNDQNSYTILHLAMHGVLNDQNPLSSYLAFSPKDSFKLYAYDLYNMKINSDLAILHACNTGSGELQKGEGVMSLSRAFTYAGCPSLVMSLWQIPEKATSVVTKSFIENLKNGFTKDVALQMAKLAYLQNEDIVEREASPAYWAGLVATGNLNALDFD